MANETVTVLTLTMDTVSADILAAAGNSVEVDATNTGVITGINPSSDLFLVLYENGGGAATATVAAGDNPPALRAGLGTKALTVPSGDCVVVCLEAARYMKSDDTIDIVVTGQNLHIAAFQIPRTV